LEDTVTMDPKVVRVPTFIQLSQDTVQWRGLVAMAMNFRVGDLLATWATISFWRKTLFREVGYTYKEASANLFVCALGTVK
jgi:hypothetical protein